MKILALDPAAATGFAWQDTDSPDLPLYGVWQLTRGDGEHSGRRLERLRTKIYDVHRARGVDRIAFEDASFGSHNPSTQALHNQLAGVILLVASELSIPASAVGPSRLKKFTTDDGRAKKNAMKAAVERHLGIRTDDDNIADALAVLLWAKAFPGGQPASSQKRRPMVRRPKSKRLF